MVPIFRETRDIYNRPKFLGYNLSLDLASKPLRIAGASWELTDCWDCYGYELETKTEYPIITPWGSKGAIEGRLLCAKKCLASPDCVSFSYPKEHKEDNFCVLKRQIKKSKIRGWNCGGPRSKWQYYTLLDRDGKWSDNQITYGL